MSRSSERAQPVRPKHSAHRVRARQRLRRHAQSLPLLRGRDAAFAWCAELVEAQRPGGEAECRDTIRALAECRDTIRVLLGANDQARLYRELCASSTDVVLVRPLFGAPPYHFLADAEESYIDPSGIAPSRCNLAYAHAVHVPPMHHFGPGHLVDRHGRRFLAMRAHSGAPDQTVVEQLFDAGAIGRRFDFAVRLRPRPNPAVESENDGGRSFPAENERLGLTAVGALRMARVIEWPRRVEMGLRVLRAMHRRENAVVALVECEVCSLS